MPPTANTLYEKSVRKNQKTKKSFVGVNLSPDHEIYRWKIKDAIKKCVGELKIEGVMAIVPEFYSPKWLNQDNTPKQKDSDNLIKSLMDSIQEATSIPDELCFYHHLFKLYGAQDRLIFSVYDLPNEIYTK